MEARAVTLLGGARVGYLRAAAPAAPAVFETFEAEEPILGVGFIKIRWIVEMQNIDNVR